MLLRNTSRKIKKSLGRYFSLLIIILLGVGFYTGVKVSIPNIQDTQKKYYDETSLADIKLISEIGFNDADIKEAKLTGVAKGEGSYSKDIIIDEKVIKLHSITEKVNGYQLINGRSPRKSNECLADADHYKVGDTIKVPDEYKENLKETTFKVVGTIYSPLYSTNEYGTSSIGNGKVYSFIFIPKENFDYEYYTEAYLVLDKTSVDIPYSKGYDLKIDKILDQLKVVKNERVTERVDEIIKNSKGQIKEESLKNVTWHFLTRDDFVTAYKILDSQYDQVNTIADVIPFFFILIVILMTSNTMARMITEERGEIGTLLSLGYSDESITFTYLVYVLMATLSGAILGYFIGTITLPQLVYRCFPINFPPIKYDFDLALFTLSIFISCLIMIYVTSKSCKKELKQQPAYLLRPEPPKRGKKVLLEKVHSIWDKLSFSMKITIRNIARYKKRVFITLTGAAGCTFMILLGFSLKDSINTVGNKQYSDLFKYDNLIILNENIKEYNDDYKEVTKGLIKDELLIKQDAFKINMKDNTLDVYLVIPEETNKLFYKHYPLKEKESEKKLKLKDNGVIITPKIAERFELNIGDKLKIESLNKKEYEVKVTGITENYVSNYIYMSDKYYQKVFEEEPEYNMIVSNNVKDKDKIARKLLESKKVVGINFSDDLLTDANEAVQGLNDVVIILVIISSMLAFTVLYNLTSINISERTREIATLKVLGFTDKESNEYIYRETLIMVIIGIIVGILITPPLHNIVMGLLEVDHMVFLREIKIQSFIYSSLLTLIFAIIMQQITFFKLKKVDMIESLKSVE